MINSLGMLPATGSRSAREGEYVGWCEITPLHHEASGFDDDQTGKRQYLQVRAFTRPNLRARKIPGYALRAPAAGSTLDAVDELQPFQRLSFLGRFRRRQQRPPPARGVLGAANDQCCTSYFEGREFQASGRKWFKDACSVEGIDTPRPHYRPVEIAAQATPNRASSFLACHYRQCSTPPSGRIHVLRYL